ncbi:hypothetical protein B0T24DRAFT_339081 [Lasiosphaeria ovina]|uniref:Ribosomal protein S15 n=1 Tax=Lasiosphaeria ovina TaxID=92902 RepID=A0AAE0K7X8_9PEZI|nr:hypothetical protein B0T24DRAFT_339081 [Lasiosphaeria ovina]
MPPRIPVPQGLRSLTLCLRPATSAFTPSFQPLIQTANLSQREKKKRMKQDKYGWMQAEQRKAAHVAHHDTIQAQRDAEWGSPIHGITTPFVESFDSAGQAKFTTPPVDANGVPLEDPRPLPTATHLKNHLLTQEELDKAIEFAGRLAEPLTGAERGIDNSRNKNAEEWEAEDYAYRHAKAVVALQRITDLNNGSAKDRKHANIRRCIDVFGRHNTDHTLARPGPPTARGVEPQPKPERAGPDTGSSEVQIAILTAKIRALALVLEGPKGNKDIINRRNLRVLCHKRQRLLRYMERKERGSERWQNMIKTLGLSPATWKEQISF